MFARLLSLLSVSACALGVTAEEIPHYGTMLGFAPDEKVVIFHIDDAGMSLGANRGSMRALTEGVASSVSIMMPCPWVPEFVAWVKENPQTDAGLHLTFTSEFGAYRWGPLVGPVIAPGLVDDQGAFHRSVADVVANASPEEIEAELRAQIARATKMGLEFTHLDSHMGTLFADPGFAEVYVRIGIEEQVPILAAGGHLQYVREENGDLVEMARALSKTAWEGGLPAIDDIHTASYGWSSENDTAKFIDVLKTMQPGITEIIIHCAEPTDDIKTFTPSIKSRFSDTLAMVDPALREALREEKVTVTTWRELMKRRQAVGTAEAR